MNRGSVVGRVPAHAIDAASMRPRFMNRGSSGSGGPLAAPEDLLQ